jgi:hypothetical protein
MYKSGKWASVSTPDGTSYITLIGKTHKHTHTEYDTLVASGYIRFPS